MIEITIAVPEAYIDHANNLAKCAGYTEDDGLTFGNISHTINGHPFVIASGLVEAAFVSDALSPLVEPA